MRLTIKTKLAAVFTTVVALSGVGMFLGIQGLGTINDSMETVVNGPVARSQQLKELEIELVSLSNNMRAMVLSTETSELTALQASMQQNYDTLSTNAQDLAANFTSPDNVADMQSFMATLDTYWETLSDARAEAMKNTDTAAFEITTTEGSAAITAVEKIGRAHV